MVFSSIKIKNSKMMAKTKATEGKKISGVHKITPHRGISPYSYTQKAIGRQSIKDMKGKNVFPIPLNLITSFLS
jgi:hypothetical protein